MSKIFSGPSYSALKSKITTLNRSFRQQTATYRSVVQIIKNEAAEKTAALRKLTHDANGSLSVIITFSSIAAESAAEKDFSNIADDLKAIQEAGQKLAKTIKNIRAIIVGPDGIEAPILDKTIADYPANILVVDDDPANRIVINRLLAKAGHTISLAGSAEEALTQLSAESFHLVISDVEMGPNRMNGLQLTQQIKGLYPRTNVVVMSGNRTKEVAESAYSLGANFFLPKPIDQGILLTVVASSLPEK